MANSKSAQKRTLVIAVRTQRNRVRKSVVRTAVRRYEDALTKGTQEDIQRTLSDAYQALDKAAGKGTIHKNTAARKKSRLAAKLNSKKTG